MISIRWYLFGTFGFSQVGSEFSIIPRANAFFRILLYQQDIAAAVDAAICKYYEATPIEEVTKEEVAAAMRFFIKDSTEKCYNKLSKIAAMSNSALGPDFLTEVYSTHVMLYLISRKLECIFGFEVQLWHLSI